jgi:hypothetical protein
MFDGSQSKAKLQKDFKIILAGFAYAPFLD